MDKTKTPSPVQDILPFFGGFGPPARFRQKANAIEAKNYNFREARTHLVNPNSLGESIVHMLMFGLGAAVVAAHEAYYLCGVWTGLSLNFVIAAINGYCVCTLVWTAQKLYGRLHMATLSYPDIAEAAIVLAPWPKLRKTARCVRYTVEGTLMFHLYGNCWVIVVMICRNLKQLVEGSALITEEGNPPLRVYIISLMLPCAIVVMITDLKNLAPFALIADLYAGGVTILMLYYSLKFNTRDASALTLPGYKTTMGLFEFIGVCIFTMESASVAVSIENNMDEPHKFHYVVLGTAPTVTVCMQIIGFCGYWLYGRYAIAPITVHFPFNSFPITLKVFLCLVLYVIYAVCFYVAFDIEWFYLKRNHQIGNYWFWERLYRTLHVIVITFIAYALPYVTRVMGVIGCVATCPAIFIYPPILSLIVDWEHPGPGRFYWRVMRTVAIVIFGICVLTAGTYYNMKDLLRIISVTSFSLEQASKDANETLGYLVGKRKLMNLTNLSNVTLSGF